jgi:hypothetical protein
MAQLQQLSPTPFRCQPPHPLVYLEVQALLELCILQAEVAVDLAVYTPPKLLVGEPGEPAVQQADTRKRHRQPRLLATGGAHLHSQLHSRVGADDTHTAAAAAAGISSKGQQL